MHEISTLGIIPTEMSTQNGTTVMIRGQVHTSSAYDKPISNCQTYNLQF